MLSLLALAFLTLQATPQAAAQEPQRQAEEDRFTVRVLEADGSPSVGRRITATLDDGLVVNGGDDLAEEAAVDVAFAHFGDRTDQDGQYQFSRSHALQEARRFGQLPRGEIWVHGTLGLLKRVPVDFESQRELTIRLPETTQLLVKLPPEVPSTVYLMVADADDNRTYVCGGPRGMTADPLGNGWYRVDPIPLNQHLEMRVHRLSDKVMVTSSPFSGMAMIPLKSVRGPVQYGEHKRVELEWWDGPVFHGRFVDAQGEPFEFHQTTSINFRAFGFAKGAPRAVTQLQVEGFEDGSFFALLDGGNNQEAMPLIDRAVVQWTPPEAERLEHLARFYEVEERLETSRTAAWTLSGPAQHGLIALGDVALGQQGSLIEFTVQDVEGKPIQHATIALEAHLPRERRSDWVEFSRQVLRTNREGRAHYAALDWRSAVFEHHSVKGWEELLPRLTVHVKADGYVRRRVEFSPETKALTVTLERERVLEGRVHASLLNRLERHSRQLQIYAVEPNGHVDWSEHLWSKPIPRETSWSKDNWMTFRLAGLPAERFDLVFRLANQDFEIARLRNMRFEEFEQPFELDLDGCVDFVQLTLLDPEGAVIRHSKEERVNVVCHFLPRSYNGPYHFAQWHEGYWWLPINRERGWLEPMDIEVKGYRAVRLEEVAPGALTLQLELAE